MTRPGPEEDDLFLDRMDEFRSQLSDDDRTVQGVFVTRFEMEDEEDDETNSD